MAADGPVRSVILSIVKDVSYWFVRVLVWNCAFRCPLYMGGLKGKLVPQFLSRERFNPLLLSINTSKILLNASGRKNDNETYSWLKLKMLLHVTLEKAPQGGNIRRYTLLSWHSTRTCKNREMSRLSKSWLQNTLTWQACFLTHHTVLSWPIGHGLEKQGTTLVWCSGLWRPLVLWVVKNVSDESIAPVFRTEPHLT